MVHINFVSLSDLKSYLVRFFAAIRLKRHLRLTNKNNLLNKVTSSSTKVVNRYFAIVIIATCLIITALSYYEQHYSVKQQLLDKSKLAHSRIEKTIQNYHKSLNAITTVMLNDRRYLDQTKVLQILKLTYTRDLYLSLLPLTWYPSTNSNKSFSAFGSSDLKQDEPLFNKIKQSPDQSIIYDQLDEILNTIDLIIIYPVVEQSDITNNEILIGYFKLSVKLPLLLQSLYASLADDDLLKISGNNKIMLFTKQDGKFKLNDSSALEGYKFTDDFTFAAPYKVSVGQDMKHIVADSLQTAALRCGAILIFGSIMLLIYNYTERKKAKKLYNENIVFVEENSSLQTKLNNAMIQLDTSKEEIENLIKQIHSYLASANIINTIDQQIKQDLTSSLIKMQDISLLKRHDTSKEVTPKMIEKTLATIHRISGDLIQNIASRHANLTEVNLDSLFDELLTIFSPIIAMHSLKLQKKIGDIDIITNELVLKQVLVSLLTRLLCSAQEGNNVKISAHKDVAQNSIIIEFSNDGYPVSEQLLENILNNNDLSISMVNIKLEYRLIEQVVKEILAGELKILKKNHNNQVALSLPIKRNKYESSDKVIDFQQMLK